VSVLAFTGWAREFADSHGYLALGLLMAICPPLPSELVLPLGGLEVSRGTLLYPAAIAVATMGAMLHALVVYAIARGSRTRLGFVARRPQLETRLGVLDRFFARHGTRVVLFGRMISGVRWLVGIPAGIRAMPLRHYVPLTLLGCTAWNAALIGAGWVAGDGYQEISHRAKLVSAAAIGVLLLVLLTRSALRRRVASAAGRQASAS
jgi:membrane protein DedA with SNARE-associated domain